MSWKLLLVLSALVNATAFAEGVSIKDEQTGIEELNPFAAGVEEYIEQFDAAVQFENNLMAYPEASKQIAIASGSCYRESCAIYAEVDKSSQTLRLYINGRLQDQMLVSSGMSGFGTPDFDKRFNGRIYDAFSSTKYPGGDYRGLGNMPYAMFISGGFAIHGTPEGNWRYLGRPASHGCIRVHPDNAYQMNRMLRRVGVRNSWVTVY